MRKIFHTTVSVKDGTSRNVLRGIVQYDTLNEVNIRLFDGSKAFNYEGYTNIILKVLKADGTAYIDSEGDTVIATDPSDGIITVILNGQATAAAGLCQGVIEIYAGSEKMTTARMNYEVFEELHTNETAASESQYPVFQRMLSDLSALEAAIEVAEAQRVVAENERVALETGFVARAEKAAEDAEMWAKVAQDIADGDYATRAELESVSDRAAKSVNGKKPDSTGNITLTAQGIGGLHNMGYMDGYSTILDAATIPNSAGYTFFAVQGSSLHGCSDAAFSGEVQYFVMKDTSAGARCTVLAYSYPTVAMKSRGVYTGKWESEWSDVFASKLGTLNEAGDSHGVYHPLYCQFNVNGDYRFSLVVPEHQTSVDHAAYADTANLAAISDPATTSLKNITAGTEDLVAGSSPLATGQFYFVYK